MELALYVRIVLSKVTRGLTMGHRVINLEKYEDVWVYMPNGERCILRVNQYDGLSIHSHIGPVVMMQSGAVNVADLQFPKFSHGNCTRCRVPCKDCAPQGG